MTSETHFLKALYEALPGYIIFSDNEIKSPQTNIEEADSALYNVKAMIRARAHEILDKNNALLEKQLNSF